MLDYSVHLHGICHRPDRHASQQLCHGHFMPLHQLHQMETPPSESPGYTPPSSHPAKEWVPSLNNKTKNPKDHHHHHHQSPDDFSNSPSPRSSPVTPSIPSSSAPTISLYLTSPFSWASPPLPASIPPPSSLTPSFRGSKFPQQHSSSPSNHSTLAIPF